MSVLNAPVSIFSFVKWNDKSGNQKSGYTFYSIDTLLNVLTNNDQADKILQVRDGMLPKSEVLTYTPAGVWPKGVRREAAIPPTPPSNQVQIDIDGAANPGILEMKDDLFEKFKSISAIGTSVKGKGLFILFNTDGADYEGSFRAICQDLEEYSIVIDDSVSSINELRYMTLNNEVLTRDNPEVYLKKLVAPRASVVSTFKAVNDSIIIPPGTAMHYRDATQYIGRCNSYGFQKESVINELMKPNIFDQSSHLFNNKAEIVLLVEKIYSRYANQFGTINILKSANDGYREEKDTKLPEGTNNHLFLCPSIKANNKFAHIIIDKQGVAEYFESTAGGKISEPAKYRLSEIFGVKQWPNIKNEMLSLFKDEWIQRDEPDKCYLYYTNGTVCITKDGYTFSERTSESTIWKSLVLQRDFKKTDKVHDIVDLAKKCIVDYKAFQIGIGYLLHRYWFRNITKVVWASDYQPKAGHDGRRGKDLFTNLVQECRNLTSVKWKKGHNFWTGSITPETSIVHFEDTSNYLISDDEIKKAISGTLNIEGKGRDIITRAFKDKPKFSASCQTMPADYADNSIRGRVWLIEFTDYLQKNPPKNILVYDDQDKSAFDMWMIECVTVYFQNIESMIGTPPLTYEQTMEAARIKYGRGMIEAVNVCKSNIEEEGYCPIKDIHEVMGTDSKDARVLERFLKCFEIVFSKKLVKKRNIINGVRTYILEYDQNEEVKPDEVPF